MERGRPARKLLPTSTDHTGWRSRGYLPHVDAPDVVQHIVFRLADSLPTHLRETIFSKPVAERVEAVDAALDDGLGRRDLAIPEIAELMQKRAASV